MTMSDDKPNAQPDEASRLAETPDATGEYDGPRVVRDEITGLSVVRGRPGQRKITSEEVRALLEDFP